MVSDADIEASLMQHAIARGADKSFCPSEVARALADDWRPLMPRVRTCAVRLRLRATQQGAPVDPLTAQGPIRLSLAQDPD
ncbi:DUF3253 domain-containing protein [Thalassorhabdomicrobium marinisediminis]|nr:DUF3253 domain-containing protein [Thalassorhabdomicrobium marinisediminis]